MELISLMNQATTTVPVVCNYSPLSKGLRIVLVGYGRDHTLRGQITWVLEITDRVLVTFFLRPGRNQKPAARRGKAGGFLNAQSFYNIPLPGAQY